MKKKITWMSLAAATFAVGAMLVVDQLLPVITVKPLRAGGHRFLKGDTPAAYGLEAQRLEVTTADGVALQAYTLPARTEAKGTILLLHGRMNRKESQLERAEWLTGQGFNCVVFDLRAHGQSTGEYCTYGYYEKFDVQELLDCLPVEFQEVPIGIWGLSLGGAIALQAAAIDDRLSFAIIESTFDELPNVVMEYGADYLLGVRSRWLADRVLAKSATLACYEPAAVNPVNAAAELHIPVLFIHGDADEKIPLAFNYKNFEAVPGQQKFWYTVKAAGHHDVWEKGGSALRTQVVKFLIKIKVK